MGNVEYVHEWINEWMNIVLWPIIPSWSYKDCMHKCTRGVKL